MHISLTIIFDQYCNNLLDFEQTPGALPAFVCECSTRHSTRLQYSQREEPTSAEQVQTNSNAKAKGTLTLFTSNMCSHHLLSNQRGDQWLFVVAANSLWPSKNRFRQSNMTSRRSPTAGRSLEQCSARCVVASDLPAINNITYSQKFWRGIKINLAVWPSISQPPKLKFAKISYSHIICVWRTAKFKSANILGIVILGSTAKFNISSSITAAAMYIGFRLSWMEAPRSY